jgi:hypothetical protein
VNEKWEKVQSAPSATPKTGSKFPLADEREEPSANLLGRPINMIRLGKDSICGQVQRQVSDISIDVSTFFVDQFVSPEDSTSTIAEYFPVRTLGKVNVPSAVTS